MTEATAEEPGVPAAFVLDGSVVLAWYFEDEADPYADAVLRSLRAVRAVVPAIWPLEVANALLMGERRARSTQADTLGWTTLIRALPIGIDEETGAQAFGNTLALARERALTAYDAAYLELAMRRRLPLAALDRRLREAATAAGVPLYAPDPLPPAQ